MEIRGRTAAGLLGAAALALGATAVWAAPDDETITACVKESSGAVRIVQSASQCKDVVLTWGREGPAGAPGPPGTAAAHRVFTLGELDSTDRKTQEVRCPAGEVATGGGFNLGKVSDVGPPVAVQQSLALHDEGDLTPVGWRVEAAEVVPTDEAWRLVVIAVCAPGA